MHTSSFMADAFNNINNIIQQDTGASVIVLTHSYWHTNGQIISRDTLEWACLVVRLGSHLGPLRFPSRPTKVPVYYCSRCSGPVLFLTSAGGRVFQSAAQNWICF